MTDVGMTGHMYYIHVHLPPFIATFAYLTSLITSLLTKQLLTTTSMSCTTSLLFQLILRTFWWISRRLIRHIVVLGDELKVIKRFKATNQKVLLSSNNRDLNRSSVIGTVNSRNTIDSIIEKWGFIVIGDKVEILVAWSYISNCNGFWTKSLKQLLSLLNGTFSNSEYLTPESVSNDEPRHSSLL